MKPVGRILLLWLIACATLGGAAQAQERSNLQEAARTFNALPLPTRYNVQMLLIASGFLDVVSNDEYNTRVYDATTNFQAQNGFARTGVVATSELRRLQALADPHLSRWQLERVRASRELARDCGSRWASI